MKRLVKMTDEYRKVTAYWLSKSYYLKCIDDNGKYIGEPTHQKYGWKTIKGAQKWAERHGFIFIEDKTPKYHIATSDGIPHRGQPNEGYIASDVIRAIRRHSEEDARLFGGKYTDYIHFYRVLNASFSDVTEDFADAI